MNRVICFLDFPGFYESMLSHALDQEHEQWIEYYCDGGEESNDDFDLSGLSAGQIGEALFMATDYRKAYLSIAKDFAQGASALASELPGLSDNPLTFESMDSPREYNFATDRLFVTMSETDMAALFAASKAGNHAALAKTIKIRFTSYDGFCSHYSNDLAEWLEKPLDEWDHNEVGTLLSALLWEEHGDYLPDALYQACFSGNGEESNAMWEGLDESRFREELAKQRKAMA